MSDVNLAPLCIPMPSLVFKVIFLNKNLLILDDILPNILAFEFGKYAAITVYKIYFPL